MATDETTPLRLSEPDRSYVYMSARNRAYRSKVRQFQCCVCAGLIGTFVAAMVVTVSYMVNHDTDDSPVDVSTTPSSPLDTSTVAPSVQAALREEELKTLLGSTWPRSDAISSAEEEVPYDPADLSHALEAGEDALRVRDEAEDMHPGKPLSKSHPSYLHQRAMYSSPEAREAARRGTVMVEASKNFYTKYKMGKYRIPKVPSKWCHYEGALNCFHSPYRSTDGSCNNLNNAELGLSMRPFRRALPPSYGDGMSSPRKAKSGGTLPSAREVSVSVHRPMYRNDPKFTVVLAVWGQFVDHDFTATALSQRKDGSPITCCNKEDWEHPECFAVPLGPGDPYYHQYNLTCMQFVRSAPAPLCNLGPREQLNQVSPFIDGSVVYGSNDQMMRDLRTFKDGLLASSTSPDGRELLPVSTDPNDGCNRESENAKGRYCFKSGDARANENLHLTTMHLILARQHNRLAANLKELNPEWSDEHLFQEARHIVAAQIQHITYNELVPIVLGKDLAEKLELTPKKEGYYNNYDPSVDPQIANEFASCAFRFGHTLLQGLLKMIGKETSSPEYVQLHKMLFNPYGLYNDGYMEKAVRGILRTDIQQADTYFSSEVSQKLFQTSQGPCGLDLVSLNIQRGRDHGLQGYPSWREHCGLSRPKNFTDLELIMDDDTVRRLESMYQHVDDIDMYTGLVSETPVSNNGLLGPTATCIIADQFVRMKKGDRFWYETPEKPQAFTPVQLNEIRKTTLSSLLCDNTDSLEEVQPLAMEAISPENPMTPCADIPRPKLSFWSVSRRPSIVKPRNHIPVLQSRHTKPPVPTAEHNFKGDPDGYNIKKASNLIPLNTPSHHIRLVLGATAVTGSVTISSSGDKGDEVIKVWDGTLPLALPTSLYHRNVLLDQDPQKSTIILENHGGPIWEGTVEVSGSMLYITGTCSVSAMERSQSVASPMLLDGKIRIEFKINWNSTDVHGLSQGKFFSPLNLRQTSPQNKFMTLFEQENEASLLQAMDTMAASPIENLALFPILLKGDYSMDRKMFHWNGEATLVFPQNEKISATPLLSSVSSSSSNSLKTKRMKRLVIGATVTKGSVIGSYAAGELVHLWDGALPVALPAPLFDQPLEGGHIPPKPPKPAILEHRGGAVWEGGLEMSGESLILRADYSMPLFLHQSGFTFPSWLCGQAHVEFKVDWNSSTIRGLEVDKYFSPMGLRHVKYVSKESSQILLNAILNSDDSDYHLKFSESYVSRSLPVFPILLKGEYMPDQKSFNWNGEVILIFPLQDASPQLSALKKDTIVLKKDETVTSNMFGQRLIMGATIERGSAIGSFDGGEPVDLWDGTLPLALPVPLFDRKLLKDQFFPDPPKKGELEHRGGAVWEGGIEITGDLLVLTADYSLPIFVHKAEFNHPSWLSGQIRVEMKVNWNSSNIQALQSNKYFTPIEIRSGNLQSKNILDDSFMSDPLPRLPIILQGEYSTDKKIFNWNGNITLVYPRELSTNFKPLVADTRPESTYLSQKVIFGGNVVSGNVRLEDGATLWDGMSPFIFNLPTTKRSNNLINVGNALFSGAVKALSPGLLTFHGSFSSPVSIDTSQGMSSWQNGVVDITINVLWNTTDLEQLTSNNSSLLCMVVLHKTTEFLAKAHDQVIDTPDSEQLLAAVMPGYPKMLPQLIIVLPGVFTSESKFSWSGKLVAIKIPTKNHVQMKRSYSVVPYRKNNKLVIGGFVTKGKIVAYSGGFPRKLWFDGSLPVAIPMPAFDRFLPSDGPPSEPTPVGPIFHGHGILWKGSVEPLTDSRQLELYGDFRLPVYEHGKTFSQEWWLGHAEMVVNVVWNSTLLEMGKVMSLPDADFFSPIRFQTDKFMATDENSFIKEQHVDSDMMETSAILPDKANPFHPNDPMPRFPIILHGYMDKEQSAFIWSGNLTMVFP